MANDCYFILGLIIVNCHFVSMSLLCIGSLLDFCWLFAFVFPLGCVYLCSHLPCTFDGWVSIHDFYLHGFFPLFVWSILLIDGVAKEFNIFIWVLKCWNTLPSFFLHHLTLPFPSQPCPFKLTIIFWSSSISLSLLY